MNDGGDGTPAQAAATVLVISGAYTNSGGMYLRMALELGAAAVLAKPFRADQLTGMVRDLLAR